MTSITGTRSKEARCRAVVTVSAAEPFLQLAYAAAQQASNRWPRMHLFE